MYKFGKKSNEGRVPQGDFFRRVLGEPKRLFAHEAALKAPVSPVSMMRIVKQLSPKARMFVGSKHMVFEIGSGKLEVDNEQLRIRGFGFAEKDWKTVTNGLI